MGLWEERRRRGRGGRARVGLGGRGTYSTPPNTWEAPTHRPRYVSYGAVPACSHQAVACCTETAPPKSSLEVVQLIHAVELLHLTGAGRGGEGAGGGGEGGGRGGAKGGNHRLGSNTGLARRFCFLLNFRDAPCTRHPSCDLRPSLSRPVSHTRRLNKHMIPLILLTWTP